ncbi:MAG: right-handed parallel beta-helix repeat-containing protein, partial [Planctomycetes bacterium]|nr:right-handed parallel beta-helix repeat-containing protein [Planctomycetota bacterium]
MTTARIGLAVSVLLVLFSLAPIAPAQIHLSGNVFDGAGGPLVTGKVYVATGALGVPATKTLTVQDGAILKFQPGTYLDVSGTLLVTGTAQSQAYFTAYRDDSVGGDTNGDGPSVGAPGDWYGIRFYPAATGCVLLYAEVRYGGEGGFAGFMVFSSGVTLDHCTVRSGSVDGINLADSAAKPVVKNCALLGNKGLAIANVRLDAVPGFTDNSASQNGGNYLDVSSASVTAHLSLVAANCLNGALVLRSAIAVPTSLTLTLGAGVVMKMTSGHYVDVSGTLQVSGEAATPIVFTSFADDSVAGDTNGDGPSVGRPGDWYGIRFNPTATACDVRHAEVRFGGEGGFAGFIVLSSGVILDRCAVWSGKVHGLDLGNTAVRPIVTGCSFVQNVGIAMANVRLESVPGFTNNSASHNGGDYIEVVNGGVSTNTSLLAENCPNGVNGALVVRAPIAVARGATLRLGARVVVKMTSGHYVDVAGTLELLGAAAVPVVFTSFRDDSIAGDTNGDGPSTGSPSDWYGIRFLTTATG